MSYEYLSSRFKKNDTDSTLSAMLGKTDPKPIAVETNVQYRCEGCNRIIDSGDVVEHQGKYYHRSCVNIDFYCTRCGGLCIGKVIHTSTQKTYHPQCFTCGHCGLKLNPDRNYIEKGGRLLCTKCASQIKEDKKVQIEKIQQKREQQIRDRDEFIKNQQKGKEICAACGKIITNDAVIALDVMFHRKCFVCKACGLPFSESQFQMVDGFPYHPNCHSKKFGKFCTGCGKEIVGKVIQAMGSDWHPSCFRCTKCHSTFSDGAYIEKNGKPYCPSCIPQEPKEIVVTTIRRRGFVVDPRTGKKKYV
ncbi:lim domain family [Anaeramoeba ignava]|uniref:Lim domain family n=1 Tax=Anaeramoeba ignava TaxID=1746090 RepID=A0A9Q0RHQ3_ANAIG|nr:lim domain family [Anaeramoeba ignava]